MKIDITRCTGCGNCASTCPQEAITIRNNLATVNRDLCIECGRCAAVCPSGAISEDVPAAVKTANRSVSTYGYRSPFAARPGIGLGRGGRPRTRQRRMSAGVVLRPLSRISAYTPSREYKLGTLKNRVEKIKRGMSDMKRRIKALEKKL